MDTVLITLAIMGFASVVLAIYILSIATFMQAKGAQQLRHDGGSATSGYRVRSTGDRRQNTPVRFPIIINGVLIREDRRKIPDRRQAVASLF